MGEEGRVWAVKGSEVWGGGPGSMLPRENFRIFGLPSTTFRAFSWWRKRMEIS